jgi:Uncharacterised nucleotidyltransferase
MQIGMELAEILAGTWRQASFRKPVFSSERLHRLAPLLTAGGGAALTWFRIRHHKSDFSRPVVNLYRETYIASVARAASHEAELERILSALQAAGIRSILLKGWSVSRLYPENGLRPSGDIDLWIDPAQRAQASEVLKAVAIGRQSVDLDHDQFRRFETRSFAEFYDSCDTVRLGLTPIKVLQREDQTRTLCLHFLKHGGWRPIWLCDIAVLLESSTAAFDWELCLGSDAKRARWIGCTIALARDLLDARIPPGAPRCVTARPPGWFTRTILREWSNPSVPNATSFAFLIPELKSRPWTLKSTMRDRWRNPIQATVDCNRAFDALPRWPYQLWDGISRAHRLLSSSKPAA